MSEKPKAVIDDPEGVLNISWHALEPEEVLESLEVPVETGLSDAEVKERLEKFGYNELQEQAGRTFWEKLWEQINSFVIWLLIGAAVISAVLGDWVEAGAILLIVVLNAIMGIIQESRAEASLAALKKMAAPEAQVLRDGHRIMVPSRELVPGDIVFIEAGNFIPADIRLLDAVNLSIDEASLTGESVPVTKDAGGNLQADIPLGDRKNSAFSGTTVTYGRGKGIVTSTGMHTQLGLIATMLQSVEQEQTPLQKRLEELGKTLGIAALIVCALVFVIGVARLLTPPDVVPFGTEAFWDEALALFMVAVSLAIAAVPEGLPAVVTISLAGGMREMVSRHALIRRLSSVETLGSVTTICTDKTGTLTQNQMTVTKLWVDGQFVDITGIGYEPAGEFKVDDAVVDLKEYPAARTALWVGTLNNDAQLEPAGESEGKTTYRMVGDPTEGSILVAALKAGAAAHVINQNYPRKQEIPFDSTRKRMVTIHNILNPGHGDISPYVTGEKTNWFTIAVKGAPDVVLGLCKYKSDMHNNPVELTPEMRQEILAANDEMTSRALRVLGVAYRPVPEMPSDLSPENLEKDLIFVGLIGMIDPSRPEVKPALKEAQDAGIRSVMITGDYPNTAKAIAEDIGLLQPGHQVLTGADIEHATPEEMREIVRITDVYARVSPEHKMKIVDGLRDNGEVVAMTGDGVNDAPAIKRADIGIAMGITGTDVAKETADMVLTDDNYASIVSAVEQGRIIYSNIRKFVYYLVSCNIAEIMIIFLAILFNWNTPLAPIQLLWLNLVTDGAPALALGTEKGDPDIMEHPPRPADEPIINSFMIRGIIVQTIAITATTLLAFWLGGGALKSATTEARILSETFAFVTLSLSELFRAFTARSEYFPLTKIGVFTSRNMNLAVLISVLLVLIVVYVPFLQSVFDTVALRWIDWAEILPLVLIPSLAAEIMKAISYKKHQRDRAAAKA
ncbi:MAG: cation-translocating P-type ATPase [Anaerolineaceae bacterium]|jgi:Ca2+-transporting ATPase|nr:cation-translocating P-type ATPase [Anaerolineaceae bacterium]MDD4042798.1 cation-translocating P-type ATPase [Anaerolineaceae bacterium]MDD4577396.1 cation-translocating P-type ATPase [Anaerolineaceae bacterium]